MYVYCSVFVFVLCWCDAYVTYALFITEPQPMVMQNLLCDDCTLDFSDYAEMLSPPGLCFARLGARCVKSLRFYVFDFSISGPRPKINNKLLITTSTNY
jgi:hypothetical protein